MNELDAKEQTTELVFEFELDAPPEKVWRAISLPEFREKWLPQEDLVDAEPISSAPGEEVSYRMKDRDSAVPRKQGDLPGQARPRRQQRP